MEAPPGSSSICKVCFWEDDLAQLRWPELSIGANKGSLIEAQRNYSETGVSEARFGSKVRAPEADEPVDDGWRRIDLSVDDFEVPMNSDNEWPEDRVTLYWWRATYWRIRR
jgi:hypothetical protein